MPNAFTPDEWSRIEAILDEVLELEPGAAPRRSIAHAPAMRFSARR